MSKFTTYKSTETVKARKVTDNEGETVITVTGPQVAAKGFYIGEDGTIYHPSVFEGETVEVLDPATNEMKEKKIVPKYAKKGTKKAATPAKKAVKKAASKAR